MIKTKNFQKPTFLKNKVVSSLQYSVKFFDEEQKNILEDNLDIYKNSKKFI